MAEKIVKYFFLQKLNWNFSQNYRPHPTHQSQCFLTCRNMLSDMPLVSVQCKPHRWKFPKLLIHFIHCDHYFRNKPPRIFRLNVSLHTFFFVENLSKRRTRANFCALEPVLPQKVQQLQKNSSFLKNQGIFSPKQLAASICFSKIFLEKT